MLDPSQIAYKLASPTPSQYVAHTHHTIEQLKQLNAHSNGSYVETAPPLDSWGLLGGIWNEQQASKVSPYLFFTCSPGADPGLLGSL